MKEIRDLIDWALKAPNTIGFDGATETANVLHDLAEAASSRLEEIEKLEANFAKMKEFHMTAVDRQFEQTERAEMAEAEAAKYKAMWEKAKAEAENRYRRIVGSESRLTGTEIGMREGFAQWHYAMTEIEESQEVTTLDRLRRASEPGRGWSKTEQDILPLDARKLLALVKAAKQHEMCPDGDAEPEMFAALRVLEEADAKPE